MEKIQSADGTPIAFETLGSGPAIVLVGGAFCDRRARAAGLPLGRELAHAATVFCYDRRGRGDSGDTAPYAVAREIEDLAAVLAAAGGSANVYGHSSGAWLALEAALAGLPIQKLALYEPPLVLREVREPMPADLPEQLAALIAAGKRSATVELFLTLAVGRTPALVNQMKQTPVWGSFEALAHTLSYDARITADPESLLVRAASLRVETLLIAGTKSQPWLRHGVERLGPLCPSAQRRSLPEQTHDVDPQKLAPLLLEFFLPAAPEGHRSRGRLP